MVKDEKATIKSKNKIKIRNLIFALILLLISAAVSYVYFIEKRFENVIYPGIQVEKVDLSGKSKEEAIQLLKENYSNPVQNKKININTPNKTYTLDFSKLSPQYNIIEVVDQALNYGKDLNIFNKYKLIKESQEMKYNLQFTYNHKPIDDMINTISKDINVKPKDASISLANGNFIVTPEKKGFQLEAQKLNDEIKNKINKRNNSDISIDASIKTLGANITAEKLNLVDSRIGHFSTNFASSSEGRATNIRLATESINGKVLMPGDTFSFNEVVGERTKERGYKEAGVIINQQLDSGLGGGICQVSSTLYNAILRANIMDINRTHHTIPVAYVDIGTDATVDWGNIDLKFTNTFDYPIYIEGSAANRELHFNIYSNSALAKRTYTITTEIYEVIEPKVEYNNDPNLLEGKTQVIKQGRNGHRVRTYRNIHENGKLIEKELVTTDYYVPINGVIKRGTKKAS